MLRCGASYLSGSSNLQATSHGISAFRTTPPHQLVDSRPQPYFCGLSRPSYDHRLSHSQKVASPTHVFTHHILVILGFDYNFPDRSHLSVPSIPRLLADINLNNLTQKKTGDVCKTQLKAFFQKETTSYRDYQAADSTKSIGKHLMESFAIAAEHSGAISHIHTVSISPAVVGIARELRLAVTVVVAGWVVVTGIRALAAAGSQDSVRRGE